MHNHEASTGRWLSRKGFGKETALPSGWRKAVHPGWQRKVGTCAAGWGGLGQIRARAAGQQCGATATQASKRLAAATVTSSFFSSVEEPSQKKGELLGLLVVSEDHFFVSVPFTPC